MKKCKISVVVAAALMSVAALAGCDKKPEVSEVEKIIAQAQEMDKDELYQKAMEEVNGKKFVVVANSSRMKNAAPAWMKYCQEHYNAPKFTFDFSSTQPKNNQIFSQIKSDVTGNQHNISMTLIQDGSQIKSKMTKPGYLLNYIPKEWKGNVETDGEPLALQSLSKVFCYNTVAKEDGTVAAYNNCWDYAQVVSTQFMAPSSEPVGQNFLYMLTKPEYAAYVKEAYDALSAERKEEIDKVIAADGVDSGIPELMKDNGFVDDAKYSLAWIYLFLKSYTRVTDDGPIANNLTAKANAGSAGLIVYSKFRSTNESPDVSNKWINIAAYQDGYKGFGGYMYKHYLQILKTSPLPWTSCALIHFMVTEHDGFQPWGKDMGGYSSNPEVQATFDHSRDGYVTNESGVEELLYPCKNDKGYNWWTTEGKLVIEDGEYASSVAGALSDWMQYL
ncbi:MAG: hypothetical protein PUG55_00915 [Bacillales bacterium]|nr:hypothetical protein [Bacillales bacterium]